MVDILEPDGDDVQDEDARQMHAAVHQPEEDSEGQQQPKLSHQRVKQMLKSRIDVGKR